MKSGSERRRCSRSAASVGAVPPTGCDLGHEPLVVRGQSRDAADDRLSHRRVRRQRGLDLAQLDAEAADLHLVVAAAEELDRAVRAGSAPSRPSGRSRARRGPNGSGRNRSRGQLWPVQVAARQSVAADADLPGTPTGTGCTPASRT